MSGRIYQINSKSEVPGERGLPKKSIESATVRSTGMENDFNRFRQEKHGGKSEWALVLMPWETIRELNKEGWSIRAGDIGENITTEGIPYDNFSQGTKYRIGEIEIQITEPCTPCGNLKLLPFVGKARKREFIQTMLGRRGWYAKVLKEGHIVKGDLISKIE